MDDPIAAVEEALEQAGRSCLRLIATRSLKPKQYRALAKWMFGCLTQRFTIRHRVEMRGAGELRKVMTFIARACEALLEIEQDDEES